MTVCRSEVARFGFSMSVKSLTLSLHLGLANGNGEVFGLGLLRHLKGNTVQQLVLQEHHCNTNAEFSGNSDASCTLNGSKHNQKFFKVANVNHLTHTRVVVSDG